VSVFTTKNFRLVGFVEAVSFLLLLFVAMPLKYFAGMPLAVSIAGALHGLIFVVYLGFLALVAGRETWKFGPAALAFVAGVLPFGPLVFDRVFLQRRETEKTET